MRRKVLIENGNKAYQDMFEKEGYEVVANLIEADLVCFTGGGDVAPDLYGQTEHPQTSIEPGRDKLDMDIYEQAFDMGVPCVGICRGGQFLHVMNGGELYQHVDGHLKNHKTKVVGYGGMIEVSSTHHQQIKFNNDRKDFIVLMENPTISSNKWVKRGGTSVNFRYSSEGNSDIEACYYADTECLCFQPHPEFKGVEECTNIFFHFLDNYIFEEENEFRSSEVALKKA